MADASDIYSAPVAELGTDLIALFLSSVNAAREKGVLLDKPDNFEVNFVERMQRWAASPPYGVSIDATTTSQLHNVANFLADALFSDQPCPDPKARLTKNELDHLLNFASLSCMIGAAVLKVSELPASRGYEPMLQEHGFNSISARGLAHLLVKSGNRTWSLIIEEYSCHAHRVSWPSDAQLESRGRKLKKTATLCIPQLFVPSEICRSLID